MYLTNLIVSYIDQLNNVTVNLFYYSRTKFNQSKERTIEELSLRFKYIIP